MRFANALTLLLDIVAPPRLTERSVRTLSHEQLMNILSHDERGLLPYREEVVRALVWELKYHANAKAAALAGEMLSQELLGIAGDELGMPLLIPVPMHAARRRERGYKQTELLCEAALEKLTGAVFEYIPHAIERIRSTPMQQGLPKHVRLKNVKDSMHVTNPAAVLGRVCVVVDDVSTTGATLTEAARALRVAGARRVHSVALAY